MHGRIWKDYFGRRNYNTILIFLWSFASLTILLFYHGISGSQKDCFTSRPHYHTQISITNKTNRTTSFAARQTEWWSPTETDPFQGEKSHMADTGHNETKLFPALPGSCAVIHTNNKKVLSLDCTFFRVTTQDALDCQACLFYCRLIIVHQLVCYEVPLTEQSGNHRDSAQPVTATGSAAHDSSSLLCSVSCWTWVPRAQEKKAQWQQLAGAFVCPCTRPWQLVFFPLPSKCIRPHMGTLARTLSCLGTGASVMFSFFQHFLYKLQPSIGFGFLFWWCCFVLSLICHCYSLWELKLSWVFEVTGVKPGRDIWLFSSLGRF